MLIFPATVSVGAVKYFALGSSVRIQRQVQIAHERDPEHGLDLSILNSADTSGFFRKRTA